MSKKDKKNHGCCGGCCGEQHENESNENKKLSEVEILSKENQELKNLIDNLKKEINSYQIKLENINNEYIVKVNEKAKEAKEILDKKVSELEEKNKIELNTKINKFVEDKFSSMLETIDRLGTIINSTNSSPEVNNYLQGFKMFLSMFQNSLNEFNIHQIEVKVGDKFNEEYMQAFELVDDQKVPSGCVSSIVGQAYKYNDKIIKHAVVRVQK